MTDCDAHNAAKSYYLDHIKNGKSMRAIARQKGVHPSTVMRAVRRCEERRDDPLVDEYLARAGAAKAPSVKSAFPAHTVSKPQERLLRRLCENGAFLILAEGMDKAAIMRRMGSGAPERIAVMDRDMARDMAMRDWLTQVSTGKVLTYRVTERGRAALRRAVTASDGFEEAQSAFAHQHRKMGERTITDPVLDQPRKIRVNLRESPVTMLARKKDHVTGKPFLKPEHVAAAERMREDFELAQLGPRITQNWDALQCFTDKPTAGATLPMGGSSEARDRLHFALTALGDGLADITFRCCCFLEGLETAEKRMGWAARSGKIVLRIALTQLARHYREGAGKGSGSIG